MTQWIKEAPLQSDLGAWLDEEMNRMTDENDNVILFHNWDFYNAPTQWIKEESL